MTTQTPPTALDIEAECLANIQKGRTAGVEADRDAARARGAFQRTEAERAAALELDIQGDPDAAEMMDAALAGAQEAARRLTEAEERGQAALRVRRSAETRLAQTRETLVAELAEDAERLVAEAIKRRDALAEPLRAYVNAYGAAQVRWRQLYAGCVQIVEQADRDRGAFRDDALVAREATCPPAPLDADVIAAVLGVTPRPPVMSKGYRPGAPPDEYGAAHEHEGPTPLFPGDPGHQRHVRGVDNAEAPGTPINGRDPATAADITRAQLERAVRG